jgi:putative membrane protein
LILKPLVVVKKIGERQVKRVGINVIAMPDGIREHCLQGEPGTMTQETASAAGPRVELAHDRADLAKVQTQLGLDRTTLAWIRTTLTITTFGFGMIGYFRSLAEKIDTPRNVQLHQGAIKFGVTLVVLGIAATMLSGISHWFSLRSLRRGDNFVLTQWPLSITLAMLLSILGLAGLWFALSH